jgi:hypothetical protein
MWRPDQNSAGTRFRLFPQLPSLHPTRPPETVWISTSPGGVGPGPADDRVLLMNPIGKRHPYGLLRGPYATPHLDLPPWRGPALRPVQQDFDGHFDHIPVGTPEFAEAHVFGSVRFTMDIWERYFGRPIDWHFSSDFDRLEVLMLPDFDNAHVGYGFMEVGEHRMDDGRRVPHALNFDVIAHELGHLIIYSTLGVPSPATEEGEYFGFQESAADMTAIIAALNFDSMIEDLLDETRGNLYAFNELNRFAELSATEQIRLASNSVTLWEFADGWDDEHDLSQPLTGALFDIFVDIFQEILVERGLIGRGLADLSDLVEQRPEYDPLIQAQFDAFYPGHREGFRNALVAARDYFGVALAETWKRLSPHFLNYADVASALVSVDKELTGGRFRGEMIESFLWRGIGEVAVGPRTTPPDESSHAFSARTLVPATNEPSPKMSFRERMTLDCGP